MALKAVIRIRYFGMYNCGCGIFSNMEIRSLTAPGTYVDPEYLINNKDSVIREFLEYMNDPTAKDPKAKIPGVIAHYQGAGGYTRLPFWVFHDNVKRDLVIKDNPFTDLSALMNYLYHHQGKYGISVTRTPMADNVYHPPEGSHPGRVYVLTPPAIPVFDGTKKLTDECKKNLKDCVDGYAKYMYPDDVATLRKVANSK